MRSRSILDRELNKLRDDMLRLASMVEEAIHQSMEALVTRNVVLAEQVVAQDEAINVLRYDLEQECLQILATQQPAAGDLRSVVAAIHVTVELERIGDHAAGIAALVKRMKDEEAIDSLHKLPKMARLAGEMVREAIRSLVEHDEHRAYALIQRDDKLDRQYAKLFRKTIAEMQADEYIRRATFLLWVGHNLERIGDRATNIAERVIFTVTGRYIGIDDYEPGATDDDDDDDDD